VQPRAVRSRVEWRIAELQAVGPGPERVARHPNAADEPIVDRRVEHAGAGATDRLLPGGTQVSPRDILAAQKRSTISWCSAFPNSTTMSSTIWANRASRSSSMIRLCCCSTQCASPSPTTGTSSNDAISASRGAIGIGAVISVRACSHSSLPGPIVVSAPHPVSSPAPVRWSRGWSSCRGSLPKASGGSCPRCSAPSRSVTNCCSGCPAVYAIKHGPTVADLADSWAPYLTMAESLKLAAQTLPPVMLCPNPA
jgi:hypothetical protein